MSLTDVSQLSLREKLQIMEAIWHDLRDHAEKLNVPTSHRELLDTRRDRVATGKAKIQDWDQVKHTIRRE
ncbi:hypothetical protein BH11VER1_BH11VER1_35130 [soil metagenome]